LVFENYFTERPEDYKLQIFAKLGRLGDAVPETIEMGYHLCYGSPQDEHVIQPKRHRSDGAYFAPLLGWRRRPETRLYLGLIHFDDQAGDTERIAAAHRVIDDFGIASECGWGQTDPKHLPGLLASHRISAAALP
jgi:hypothetical protein